MAAKLVFVGFMGSGKTTAAKAAAAAAGSTAVDTDQEIERRAGKPIARIFAEDGEASFRALEEATTRELLAQPGDHAVSLGGGAITSEGVRRAIADHTIIWMDVDPDTAWARVAHSDRPLARDRQAFERLYAEREPLYASLAHAIVPAIRSERMKPVLAALRAAPAGAKLIWAAGASSDYPAYIAPGAITRTPAFWPEHLEGRRFLVTDGNAGRLYGDAFEPLSGRTAIMPGEQSKTVAHADIVWTELARSGATRSDLIVALGGGVVGDLAGFCAATYQRGVRYVQVPTTLVAQVDSAYGGKTGVDLAEAKNYVGAYHQPSAVIADPEALNTLPQPEVAAGYAEVVKTALLAGGELWDAVRAGADPTSPAIILRCVRTKLNIVAADERDADRRQVLNLGHTVGHAIETVTGYARYRHGEAVGLGLLAALRISGQPDLRAETLELLAERGLPTTLNGADPEQIVAATWKDKKRVGEGPVPFVLLEAPGRPRPGCAVRPDELLAAVSELSAPS